MTSSLVGSEMCIRDSLIVMGTTWDPAGPFEWGILLVVSFGQNERMAPVSYTHLTLPTICSV
eukprot:6623659-Prorocentrum_lima.AAC.1